MLLKNSCFCTTQKSYVSIGFAEQIMPILYILYCNGCLVTWTVISLTTAKVKVKVTLRLTVNQSVSLGVEPHLGLMIRYLLPFNSYGLLYTTYTRSLSIPAQYSRSCSIKVKVKVMLRPTVQSASLSWNKYSSEAYDRIFITVRQLQACWCGALSLTKGRVCRLPDSVSSDKSLASTYNLHVTSY
jgi:hypothetical protein